MNDRYKSRASTRADGCGKWYIVDIVVREKILVEISGDEDEHDAKEIALDESRLFQQTELEVQVNVEPAPAAPEYLEREMRYADLVIPRWDGGESREAQQDRGHGHYECAAGEIKALRVEVEQLRADLVESDEIREKSGHLLTRTAAALKGEPPEGVWHSWRDLPERAALATHLADDAAESVICTEGQIQRPGVWRITREVLDADRAYLSDCLQHLGWRQMADVAEDHNTGDVIVTFRGEHPADSEATPALSTEQWRSD